MNDKLLLLRAAEDLSTQLHSEEVRGLIFSKKFDMLWAKLTAAILAEREVRGLKLGE